MARSTGSAGFTIAEVLIAASMIVLIGVLLAAFVGGQGRVNKDIHQEARTSMTHATLFTQLEADLKHTNHNTSALGQVGGRGGRACLTLADTSGERISYCTSDKGIERSHGDRVTIVAPKGQSISVVYSSDPGGSPPGFIVTLTPPARADGTMPAGATRRVTPRGGA